MSRYFFPLLAVPANPEERTHIEDADGNLVCFVEDFGDHRHDYGLAQSLAAAANRDGFRAFNVVMDAERALLPARGRAGWMSPDDWYTAPNVIEILRVAKVEGGAE